MKIIAVMSPKGGIGKTTTSDSMRAVEEIYTGGLAKVTLNLRGGGKASISQNVVIYGIVQTHRHIQLLH